MLIGEAFTGAARPELGLCRLEEADISMGRQKAGGRWAPLTCFSVCVYLPASALQFLHERNISHLDLKPQNILLSSLEKPHLKLAGMILE